MSLLTSALLTYLGMLVKLTAIIKKKSYRFASGDTYDVAKKVYS